MTDLITRARKEWCEIHRDNRPDTPPGLTWDYIPTCPPEVVAALLAVLRLVCPPDQPCFECSGVDGSHTEDCTSGKAEAAITRALEEKP
jgi:hypothetical protein